MSTTELLSKPSVQDSTHGQQGFHVDDATGSWGVAAQAAKVWTSFGTLMLRFQLGLELAVGGFLEIQLKALAALTFGVARAGAILLQAAPQEQHGLGVFRSPVERSAKALGGAGEFAALPEGVAQVEMIIRVGPIAFERPAKVVDGGWRAQARLRGAQVVEHLVERHGGGHHLETFRRACEIGGVIAAQAQQERRLKVVRVGAA